MQYAEQICNPPPAPPRASATRRPPAATTPRVHPRSSPATHLPRHLAPLRQPPPRHPLASSPPPPPRPPRAPKRLTAAPCPAGRSTPHLLAMRTMEDLPHQSPPPGGHPLCGTRVSRYSTECRMQFAEQIRNPAQVAQRIKSKFRRCVSRKGSKKGQSPARVAQPGLSPAARHVHPIFGLVRPVGAPERGRRHGRRCR